MLTTQFTTNIFAMLISEALFSVVKQSAKLDIDFWQPVASVTETSTFTINMPLDYALSIKGFRSIGIHTVIVRFNIDLFSCDYNNDNDGFIWEGGRYGMWGGFNCNNFIFLDAEGNILEAYGRDSVYQTCFKGIDDEAVSVELIKALKLSMSDWERQELFDNSLRAYNKLYKESLKTA